MQASSLEVKPTPSSVHVLAPYKKQLELINIEIDVIHNWVFK